MKRLLPAYPLWIIDPMFSVWSRSDELNKDDTSFWAAVSHRAYGLVRYDGKTYCFMGRRDGAERLEQTNINITAFATEYGFCCDKFELGVKFISPRIPTDLKLMSCPICYTDYEVKPKSGKLPDDFSVVIALDEDFCYNRERAAVVGSAIPLDGFETAFFTRKYNITASNTSDYDAPDYGSTYITGDEAFFITETALNEYVNDGIVEYKRNNFERSYILGVNKSTKGSFITAFDDTVSVFYFGEWLKGYFFKDGATIIDAIDWAKNSHDYIIRKLNEFDDKLKCDCENIGKDYYLLACAALRQSVGGHKLVQNGKGELLFLSKECNSGGFIGTVDVSYPSIPLYLLYNPNLVNAMMTGVFEFARMPVWTYGFAPHDIGMYPHCAGQIYGANKTDDKYNCGIDDLKDYPRTAQALYLRSKGSNAYNYREQMPVEECGNMLIMTAAALLFGADQKTAKDNFDLLNQWVEYLEKFGLKPEEQLCTDDFAGHLANNVNLAIKALVGIESFSVICDNLGKTELAKEYLKKAKVFAEELKKEVGNGIMPLAYGQKDSYSLKYNILFDKLFGCNLIGQDICEKEVDYYITKSNRFGVPLDTRKDYSKTDWILWCAALTEDSEKCEKLYAPIVKFLEESPSREPFIDWYGTVKGEYISFRNRTVQGGIFAPLLHSALKNRQQ